MKSKISLQQLIQGIIRAVFFFFFPAVFSIAFTGVKYMIEQMAAGKSFELNSFLIAFLVVIGFTVVFGRFFCGFACAFGTYGDVLYEGANWFRKNRKKKSLGFSVKTGNYLKYGKYVVLVVLLFMCFVGKSGVIGTHSPWTVFSRLHAWKFSVDMIGLLIFVVLSIAMIVEKRFFCRFICPLGAIFTMLPVMPFSAIKRDRQNCIKGCRACQIKCPANINIADSREGDNDEMGECFSCGKCVAICPKSHIYMNVRGKKEAFEYAMVIKAVILIGICLLLGL